MVKSIFSSIFYLHSIINGNLDYENLGSKNQKILIRPFVKKFITVTVVNFALILRMDFQGFELNFLSNMNC